jgi:hypothetical protein
MIRPESFGDEIDILSWDASYSHYENPPYNIHPVISFNITPELLSLSRSNQDFIPLNITNTKYEGMWWAWISPEHRTNVYRSSGGILYTATLNTFWRGYPYSDDLGTIKSVSGILIPKFMKEAVERGHPLESDSSDELNDEKYSRGYY